MTSLRVGILVPFLYFGTLIVSSLLYPGYSHVRQYASELGAASAPYPIVFNAGIVLFGLAILVALAGFGRALRALGAGRVLTTLFLLTLGAFGAGMVMGALFPMPDPRHGAFGLAFGIHLAPAFLAAALWRSEDHRALRLYLLATVVAGTVMLAVMMGVGGLVTRANVGMFQRLHAIVVIPWIGVASYALLARRSAQAGVSPPNSVRATS
ncbi:MAG TPA: DUF998 domain-containing protein [Thermoanaerobaculia bacterium]